MNVHTARTWIFLIGGVAALVYAFIPPANPVWVGIAGTLLGAEPLARAKDRGDKPGAGDEPA